MWLLQFPIKSLNHQRKWRTKLKYFYLINLNESTKIILTNHRRIIILYIIILNHRGRYCEYNETELLLFNIYFKYVFKKKAFCSDIGVTQQQFAWLNFYRRICKVNFSQFTQPNTNVSVRCQPELEPTRPGTRKSRVKKTKSDTY